jgi:predicted acetyltransferase
MMITRLSSDKDTNAFSLILSQAFGGSPNDTLKWIGRAGKDNVRILRSDGEIAAGLILIPMGQWFGGRSVSSVGIAAVGTVPHIRGRRSATRLMHGVVRELRESGYALSSLYPATVQLYRRAGYELAGGLFKIAVPANEIHIRDRDLTVRPIEETDREGVEAAYSAYASRTAGYLDRVENIWNRIRTHRTETVYGYLVEADGNVEGYLYYFQTDSKTSAYDLYLSDFVATTERAARRLWGFLWDQRTLVGSVRWRGGPADSLLTILPDAHQTMTLYEHWMLRVLDVKGALEARGYNRTVTAKVELSVKDDVIPENSGNYLLHVADGRARVRAGGSGAIQIDIRGLASLYTGFRDPAALRLAGLIRGDDRDLAAAASIFAGPAPAMSDDF